MVSTWITGLEKDLLPTPETLLLVSSVRGPSHRVKIRPTGSTHPHKSVLSPLVGAVTLILGCTLISFPLPSSVSCAQSPSAHSSPAGALCLSSGLIWEAIEAGTPCSSLLHCGFVSQALGFALCLQTIPGFTKEPGATRMQPNLWQSFSRFKWHYSEVRYGAGVGLMGVWEPLLRLQTHH